MSMRFFSIRWLAFVSLAILLVVMTACGDENGDGEPSDTDAPTDTSTTEETTTEESDSGDATSAEPDLDRPIVFSGNSHDSALMLNHVARYILENGYGYETDEVPGETIPLFQGMVRGDIDITMEIWVDQMPDWEDEVDNGTLLDLGTVFGESIQGWFVPTYVIEGDEERGIEASAPDLQTIDDLPEYSHIFADPEDPEKGRFYDCIAGWECEKVHEAKFEAYGLNDSYNRFLPGSGAALATSLVTAYEQGEPWFGYYWAPTWIFGQYDLTMIEEPEYTEECWDNILSGEEACAYPEVPVHKALRTDTADEAPEVREFLENFELTMDDVSEVLYYMHDEDAGADEGAIWFLNEREDLWTAWVPADVAERVNDALDS